MKTIKGIQVLLSTPMTAGGALDYESTYRLIEHVIRGGVHGIILLGSTGEFFSLSEAERKEFVERATDRTRGVIVTGEDWARIAIVALPVSEPWLTEVGLFAETLVPHEHFERIQQRSGAREAFEAKESIDLVVTSMGDIKDEHDLLGMFLRESSKQDFVRLERHGCIGNVQYRPYSAKGPILDKAGDLRAVTLYELDDLVRIASQKHRHVILIARQCGRCIRRTRAEALLPLLTNPNLKAFSTLVMDAATARELLRFKSKA